MYNLWTKNLSTASKLIFVILRSCLQPKYGLHYKFWGRKYNTAELTFQGSCCLGHSQMQGIKCCDAWPRKLPTDWLAPEQYLLLDQNKQKLDASYQPHIISETSTWPLGGLLRWKVSIPQDHTCQQTERMRKDTALVRVCDYWIPGGLAARESERSECSTGRHRERKGYSTDERQSPTSSTLTVLSPVDLTSTSPLMCPDRWWNKPKKTERGLPSVLP